MNKILGVKLSVPEGSKIVKVPMSEDLKEYLGFNDENQQKNHFREYLKRYLADEVLFDKLEDRLLTFAQNNIPKEVRQKCPKCNGTAKDENDSLCIPYTSTAQMNYFLAGNEFVGIVERNKHLVGSQEAIKNLTIQFFQSFIVLDGYLAFDLFRIIMHTLNAGFLTLTQIFAKNEILQNLTDINRTIDALSMEELEYQTTRPDEDPFHIGPQKKFFKDKRKYFKEEVFIQKQKKAKPQQGEEMTSKEDQLRELGFFELSKVIKINGQKLIEHLEKMTVPYQIAYFDYLGLIDYMYKKQGLAKKTIDRKLSIILKITERTAKGHRSVLNPNSTEDRNRYTAHKHKDEVEKHYQTLK